MRGEYLEACYPYDKNDSKSVALWDAYNGAYHYVDMNYSERTGLSIGSFTMSNCGVIVTISDELT